MDRMDRNDSWRCDSRSGTPLNDANHHMALPTPAFAPKRVKTSPKRYDVYPTVMPNTRITFTTVCKIAEMLPNVEESTMYGSPCLKVAGKLLACVPTHKSAEPGSLIVSVGFERREGLIADAPEIYYLKEHYVNYPVVLVRLPHIHQDALRDLLNESWKFVSSETVRRKQAGRGSKRLAKATRGS